MDTTETAGDLLSRITAEPKLVWWLNIVWHPTRQVVDRRISLRGRRQIILGRYEAVFGEDVQDTRMSRRHASIKVRDGAVRIEDLSSRNGTWINGTRVLRGQLRDGDILAVGSMLLVAHRAPLLQPTSKQLGLEGESAGLSQVIRNIEAVASHDTPVLILGESGTGKELVARALHDRGERQAEFYSVNCGAMSDELLLSEMFGHRRGAFSGAERDRVGILEAADGGTVLLDEVGDAGQRMQVALLRFLQEGEVRRVGDNRPRKVNTRVIAATHRDLSAMVSAGDFREDLLARLEGWTIRIPPLRARRVDILTLARCFAEVEANHPVRLSYPLARALLHYHWPQNIRQLQSVMRRTVIDAQGANEVGLSSVVKEMLEPDPAIQEAPARSEQPESAPRTQRPDNDTLRALMSDYKGNVRAAAKRLSVPRSTLYRWLSSAGIEPASLRNEPAV